MPARTLKPRATEPLISKALLARTIARILDERGLTQTEAAHLIKDAPSQLSLIVNGRRDGFSAERLLRILTQLGKDVEIRTSKAKTKQGKVSLQIS